MGFYGFWLPNDPRGSGSDYIASWELFRYGPATKTHSRRSVAHKPHDHKLRLEAKQALKYPPVEITGQQAVIVAKAFWKAAQEAEYQVHACAILPDHLHLVIGWHWRDIRLIVGHLRAKATKALRDHGEPPFDDIFQQGPFSSVACNALNEQDAQHAQKAVAQRPVWGAHGWNVPLDNPDSVDRAIRYAENNPEKEGKPRQHWRMVVPFEHLNAVAARAAAVRAGIPLYEKRRVGGAAKRSHEAKVERDRKRNQDKQNKEE
jgi:REP element-mobilizing transposase RayT